MNKKRVEEVKERMKNKSADISKEFWAAKVILDMCPPKKVEETRLYESTTKNQYCFTKHINNIRHWNNGNTK